MAKKDFKLTGWHALGIFGGAFAVIIGVNIALAYSAVKTFPGLETKNSYVASQTFDIRRAAQENLGWTVDVTAREGEIVLSITDENGKPVQAGRLEAVLGRATSVKDDIAPEFAYNGKAYIAREALGPGKWVVRMKANALDGTEFQQRLTVHVEG